MLDETMSADLSEEEFAILREFVHAEQNYFWMRFAAFSAVLMGQLVLLTEDRFASTVTWSGLATSLFWAFVQFKSLQYVEHKKRLFWTQSKVQKLRMVDESTISSTRAGFYFTLLVFAFWGFVALSGS